MVKVQDMVQIASGKQWREEGMVEGVGLWGWGKSKIIGFMLCRSV